MALDHDTRVGHRSRAGELQGYPAICSCGWGYGLPLHPTEELARQAGDAHVIAECDHPDVKEDES